jgi:predicted NUDIX family NTP pyrophosphohydrolase
MTEESYDAMARSKVSAGLLMFRTKNGMVEVLLAHPGGPYFQKKDDGYWTVPKGEIAEGEDLLTRAKIEFEEEVGVMPQGEWIELGHVKQKGGKTVHAWAFEGNLKGGFAPVSNTFELEWPPHSGRTERFPEVDRVGFFSIEDARRKMKAAQRVFLDRLVDVLDLQDSGQHS